MVLFGIVEQSNIASLVNPANKIEKDSKKRREKVKSGVLDKGCATNLDSGICLANVETVKGEVSHSLPSQRGSRADALDCVKFCGGYRQVEKKEEPA